MTTSVRSLRRRLVVIAGACAASLAAGMASAKGAPALPAAPESAALATTTTATTSHWYGWQNLLADGGSIVGGLGAAAATSSTDVLWIGVVGYFLGSPVIHVAHGRVVPAIVSLAMHVGLPYAGVRLGAKAEDCPAHEYADGCGIGGALIGLGIGVLAATAIDAAALAYEDVATPTPTKSSGFGLSPTFAFDHGRTSLGLAGRRTRLGDTPTAATDGPTWLENKSTPRS